MKKLLCIILAFAMSLLLLVLPAYASGLGDIDEDGKVTSADARLALRAAVGLEDISSGSGAFTAADADKDGKITSADARLILRAAVGLEQLPGEAPDCSDIKFGLICLQDDNSAFDLNFIRAAFSAAEELGIPDDNPVIRMNVPEGEECYEAACELAEFGCDVIFADSFGHEEYMIEAAKEYPDVQFIHIGGTKAHTEKLANYHNAYAALHEAAFLSGAAAGMKLNEMIGSGEISADEAKLGYVGAYSYTEVVSRYTAFFLGARSVCPSVTMDVKFTRSWYDETAEKEAAEDLIDNGCVLISQFSDSMGAPNACEKAGVPNIPNSVNTLSACPDTFLISSRIDWTPVFKTAVTEIAEGRPLPYDLVGSSADGSVVLSDPNTSVAAAGTAQKLAQIQALLASGELRVFDTSTFTVDGEKLTSYIADVDDDGTFTPETEAIVSEDGVSYFAESDPRFRSAPFFDVWIDGITMLNFGF